MNRRASVVVFLIVFCFALGSFLAWGITSFLAEREFQRMEEEFQAEKGILEETLRNAQMVQEKLEREYRELEREKEELEKEKEEIEKLLPPRRTAYLTFDDGPTSTTPIILNILDQYDVPATFFVCGNDSDWGRNIYREILERGHLLGNHTYSHNYRDYLEKKLFLEDFFRLEELIFEEVGVRPAIYRFPGGSNNSFPHQSVRDEIIVLLAEMGYTHFDWNVGSGDTGNLSSEQIYRNVMGGAAHQQHAVILFHDRSQAMIEALPRIIEGLKNMGFVFDTVNNAPYTKFVDAANRA